MSQDRTEAERLLYEAIVELAYVQEAGAGLSLCASSIGADIINRGMMLLGVSDLSAESLL